MRLDFNTNLIITFILFLFIANGVNGQAGATQSLYNSANNSPLHEKIYVHTDQSFYVCGEVLWLKAYLSNAINNKPLSVSKVVYVELLNNLNQPVLQSKIAADSGVAPGSLFLPFTLPTGNYVLRAYTNWMKNFSPGNYFVKNISIVNTTTKQEDITLEKPKVYSADFFPEGGNMVIGLESVVAFKILDETNKGAAGEGVLVDEKNDTITHFKTSQFGMGQFKLTPQQGKEYTAIISCTNGTIINRKLPKAMPGGYVMHLADEGKNHIEITVSSNGEPDQNSSEIIVLFQNNRKINFARGANLINHKAIIRVSKDSLVEGITEVTVFDAGKRPVGERLYFKPSKDKAVLHATAGKENFGIRSKVKVELSASDAAGKAIPGNFSAAVFHLDELHQPDNAGILSYVWLSSVLKGNIENPDYYFENDNEETRTALNNLLMTQGWRKFRENNIAENKNPVFKYMPEWGGHFITGRITNKITGKPVGEIPVYLSVPGKRVQLRTCISDSMGLVYFEMKDFYGRNQVVLQTESDRASQYNFEIFSPYSPGFTGEKLPVLDMNGSNDPELLSGNFNMAVQNTYHQSELEKLSSPKIDSLPFYFKADKVYNLDDYKRFTTMEEVMREYVLEVNVRKKGSQFRFATLNLPGFDLRDKQPAVTIFENDPLVLLDGVPVFDINKIVAYDPLKVQKLEVVAQKYRMGTIAAEGIVSYTTYNGNLEGFTLDPNDLVLDYEGLQQQRIFYSPQYNTISATNNRMPDFRSLLYWSPKIVTGQNGKTDFSFYTGDIPGRYMVVLQGISDNGDAGKISFIFNVKK